MFDFSIIMLNFNSSKEQIEHTFMSVLEQKNIKLEIIVCDDASKDNNFSYMKQLFEKYNFTDYKLLGSEQNLGTVRNILRGLKEARGTYAKLIGMGDLLYNQDTLRQIADFMKDNNSECCFGLIKGYKYKSGKYYPARHKSPMEIQSYRKKNNKNIIKNILIAEDWVSGVSIFAKKDYYYKYISLLKDRVIYCEDWATALAFVDNIYLDFIDQYVVWYEVGDGVSTTPNPEWRKKLLEDNRQFWEVLKEYAKGKSKIKIEPYIKANKRKKKYDNISFMPVQFLMKALTNPYLIGYWMKVIYQDKKNKHLPTKIFDGFLDDKM